MSPDSPGSKRTVWGVVDGSEQYYSRLVLAGSLVFMCGNSFDGDGAELPSARVPLEYRVSPPASVHFQTRAIYDAYVEGLTHLGSSLDDVVQIEQYIPHKVYGDGYVNTSRGPGYLERRRPASALLVTGDLAPVGAVIAQSGIATVPATGNTKEIITSDEFARGVAKAEYGASWASEPPFNEVVTAGPHLFTVGDIALDWDKGVIFPEVKVASFTYWGNEARNETTHLLRRLVEFTSRVGGTLADLTHVSVYLTEISDMFEMDRVWGDFFGANPPARTVIPSRAQGSPRLEAAGQTHADEAVRMEILSQGIRPGHGAAVTRVQTSLRTFGNEASAVRGGDYVWISQQYALAGDEEQIMASTEEQIALILDRIRVVCTAAGTDIRQLVRIRGYFTNVAEARLLAVALRQAIPHDPPTVLTSGVDGPLLVPGATVMLDGIVFAPQQHH